MMPTTGYTPEMDERRRLRNEIKACIDLYREAGERHTANLNYWYGRSLNAIVKYREYLRSRVDANKAACATQPEG